MHIPYLFLLAIISEEFHGACFRCYKVEYSRKTYFMQKNLLSNIKRISE